MDNILILEDDSDTSQWLRSIVERLFSPKKIACAATLQDAHQVLESCGFELVFLDINLPDGCGIDLIGPCREKSPDSKIVISTVYDDDVNVFRALRAGADGYLLKGQGEEAIVAKLKGIEKGEVAISPSIARRMLKFFSQLKPMVSAADSDPVLTEREKEILTLIAKGYSRKEIGALLGITVNTTASYIKGIYRKLGISSKSEATAEANRRGLVHWDI